MFSIEKQVDVLGSRQVVCEAVHSARMTLAERGGRAVMRVLCKDAKVLGASAVATGVDVEVSGRLVASVVCEIAGGEIVCLEYSGNFNFAHKAVGVFVPAVCDVSALVSGVRVIRASGCEVAIEADIVVKENFAVSASEPSVVSAVDCYSEVGEIVGETGTLKVHDFVCSGEFEVPKAVSSVLASQFFAECTGISARGGSVVCNGFVHGFISFLDINGKICREVCSFPFREEFSCENADDRGAFVRACECSVVCEVNEVRGSAVVSCEVELEVSLWSYSAVKYEKGENFFSDKMELTCDMGEFVCSDFVGMVQGSAKFSEVCEWPFDLPSEFCVVNARVASVKKCVVGNGVCGEIVCCVSGGDRKFQEFAVKYSVDLPVDLDGTVFSCDAVISEIDARVSGGGVEVFGRVCVNAVVTKERKEKVACGVAVGGEKVNVSGGFVLYRTEIGETLLDVCEAVGVMPEVLKSQNPGVVFPVTKEGKVVVWKN